MGVCGSLGPSRAELGTSESGALLNGIPDPRPCTYVPRTVAFTTLVSSTLGLVELIHLKKFLSLSLHVPVCVNQRRGVKLRKTYVTCAAKYRL